MIITFSNASTTLTLDIASCTAVGFSDDVNSLLIRVTDHDELVREGVKLEDFIETETTVNVASKVTFVLTPIGLKLGSRYIDLQVENGGDIQWS